jgi:hypothetical protein
MVEEFVEAVGPGVIKRLILDRGFLDGWRGLVLAVLYAEYVFLRMAKAWEARRAPGPHGGL